MKSNFTAFIKTTIILAIFCGNVSFASQMREVLILSGAPTGTEPILNKKIKDRLFFRPGYPKKMNSDNLIGLKPGFTIWVA